MRNPVGISMKKDEIMIRISEGATQKETVISAKEETSLQNENADEHIELSKEFLEERYPDKTILSYMYAEPQVWNGKTEHRYSDEQMVAVNDYLVENGADYVIYFMPVALENMTLEYVLKENGIEPGKDVTLDDSIKFDLMAGAFTGGNAEYVTLFEPTASMTQDAGKGYIVASVGEAAGEVPYTAYCAKKSYIAQNSDIIEGFTKAIYKGEQYVKEHTAQEIAEKIQNYFPDTTLESLTKSVQTYKDIEAWKENPILKEEAFDKLQEIMTMAGELTQKAPYEKIVNNSYAEKVIK